MLDQNQHVRLFDRLRTTPGLREVEISYAIITDLCLELLPQEDALFEEAVYTPLARQGRLTSYVSDHRYYSVGSLERLPATEAFMRREPTIILDRDGVLNRKPPQAQYVRDWRDWEWCAGSLEALRLMCQAGYRTIIASNQPGIGRGLISKADLSALHCRMQEEAARVGGRIEAVYYCPHNWDEGCECRKPKPGLLYQAQRDFHLDLTRTPFIGDDERDAAASAAVGSPFHWVTATRSLLEVTRQQLKLEGTLANA
jgi:D-glycero-D-manno-heptose 1,7-bisphosphate phosphatase